jgi:eukaryotic-like serine/threonine-protein kinase
MHYCAFLSYSHADEKHAEWLHRCLEQFRVPKALVGGVTARGTVPSKLGTVFRDRQELAASSDLGGAIRDALAQSRALIVLCSPTAAKSRWTDEEIRSFKRLRPDGPILAAIVAGEPFASEIPGREAEECFPPALRQRFDAEGEPSGERGEPIAADLREGRDGRRVGLLKIVAGLLGVGLDDLVQRETQRRQKRLALLAAASLAGMAVTSTLAVTAYVARDEAREQRREAEGLVGFMLGDLREKLEPIGRLDALDAVGSRALQYFAKQDKSELSDEALAQRARALTLIGEIANTRGDLAGALKRYREALASTAESVRRYPDDPKRLFDHAQNVYWVGYIAFQRGQLEEAARLFEEYKSLAQRMLALAPGDNEYRREIVYANTNLGTVLLEQRRYPDAVTAFQESVRVAEALAASEPGNASSQRQVSNNLGWLADAHEFSGALEQALTARERQLGLLQNLERSAPGDTMVQRHLMTVHRTIGRLLASRGDIAAGLKESLVGVAIGDRLFRVEPENTEWLQANAGSRFDLADLQLSAGQAAQAASTTRAACDIVDRLVRRDSSVADWKARFRVHCLTLRARLSLAAKDNASAVTLARSALAAARTSPKPTDRVMLSMVASSIGSSALAGMGREAEAVSWARSALAAIPAGMALKPREAVEVAALKLRAGDQRGADEIVARLTGMGYRHPALTSRKMSQIAS